jgi:osmoprotectant transport system ATP-binding protein
VDPVVRDQLQREFLRLQEELRKTILFVTHDIDEAIRLGDRVAVLQVGGRLAQIASPAELLARPADPFVAGFVGRDRGYRALGFVSTELPLAHEPTVTLGARLQAAGDGDRWVLVVDGEGAPQGWLDLAAGGGRDGVVEASMLNLGGTLATAGGTLRETLDAALSSPSGRGVVVDDAGHLLGTVTAAQVLEHVASAEASPAAGGGR